MFAASLLEKRRQDAWHRDGDSKAMSELSNAAASLVKEAIIPPVIEAFAIYFFVH